MNIKEMWDLIKTYKKAFMICILVLIVVIPVCIYLLLWAPIPTNNSDDNGWLSFWGSFLGGMFGEAGTLIAVIITTTQARRHQVENLNESIKIQKENLKQIKIKNLDMKIYDLREKLKLILEFGEMARKEFVFNDMDFDVKKE